MTFKMKLLIFIFLFCFLGSCEEGQSERFNSSYDKKENKLNKQVITVEQQETHVNKEDDEYNYKINYKYHYTLTISNAQREWETYETQEMINGEVRLHKISPDVSYLNGYYEWDSDIYLPDENAMFNYICDNYEIMKKYKVSQY